MTTLADDCSTSALPGYALSFTALAAILTAATSSAAEPLSPLSAGLFGSPQPPAQNAERFVTPDGVLRFTLDRSGPAPLMRFEGARARAYYRESEPLLGMIHPASRRALWALIEIYSRLLAKIEASGYDVLSRRIALSVLEKAGIVAGAALR